MKRIIFVVMLIFLLCSFASGQSEYEVLSDGLEQTNNTNAQIIAGISQLNKKIDAVEQTAGQCFKQNDISKLEKAIKLEFEEKANDLLGKVLILLLVYTAFFYATLFIAKSKGWF